jgi:CMP-N,N'-diacetyllegionaminic acid synthase
MLILGLIPARGGSKGVPRKNARSLCGKPLLAYTAEAALAARRLSRVILSTDDAEIAEIGRRCQLEVPFMRPVELARDDTPMLPVVQHAVAWLKHQGEYSTRSVCYNRQIRCGEPKILMVVLRCLKSRMLTRS